jgi:hypothetical protein
MEHGWMEHGWMSCPMKPKWEALKILQYLLQIRICGFF